MVGRKWWWGQRSLAVFIIFLYEKFSYFFGRDPLIPIWCGAAQTDIITIIMMIIMQYVDIFLEDILYVKCFASWTLPLPLIAISSYTNPFYHRCSRLLFFFLVLRLLLLFDWFFPFQYALYSRWSSPTYWNEARYGYQGNILFQHHQIPLMLMDNFYFQSTIFSLPEKMPFLGFIFFNRFFG